MKVLILGHYEIASNYAISLVVNDLLEHDLTIMLSGKGDAFEEEGNEFSRLARYEQQLCDDLNDGIDILGLECDGFNTIAQKTGSPIEILPRPNSKLGIKRVNELQPDLIISIRYRKILKQTVIDIPKMGVINLHSGRLPQYRGAMATFWSMLNQEKTIGSTLHYISDPGIDTGAIIAQTEIDCDYQKSYLNNVIGLYPDGCKMISNAAQSIAKSKIFETSSQSGESAYYSFPSQQDLKHFEQLGSVLY